MADGVILGYQVEAVRQGGAQAIRAGETASGAAGVLRPAACSAASLGVVAGAQALAAALVRARDAHAELADQVQSAHVDLDARAGRVAADGAGLTSETATIAGTGAPGGIAR